MFRKVAIFVKPTESLAGPLTALISVIRKAGAEVFLDERSAKTLGERAGLRGYTRAELGKLCDLAVVLGGDGTMLGVARSLAPFGTPIVGVNAGRLGFITDIVLEDMERLLPALLQGQCTRDVRRMLSAELVRNGESIFSGLAVNDIGVSHGRAGGMVEFIVYVNGIQMASQSADGIICSTPTGSTAYSLAAGGPLLAPMLDGVTLVPVAPHTLSNRPIVLPGESSIDIEITESRDAVAYFDMQEFADVQPGDVLKIRPSQRTFTMLHPIGYDYFDLLRRKLKWNFMPTSSRQDPNDGKNG
jgi:NAD+ kinase